MSIPEAGFPRTATVSPRVHVVGTTDSTNADVVAAVTADPSGWPSLSLLLTDDQRAGRGRLDRSWTAPAGTAIAVSMVVDASRVPLPLRGWIPLTAGAAMTKAVGAQLAGHSGKTELKWPNDVLVDGGKICGILAEAVPGTFDTVVVGAGVNTRMNRADLPVSTATSFAAVGASCDVDRLLAEYVEGFAELLTALSTGGEERVHRDVEKLCATIGREVTVALPDGTSLTGRATHLDETGRLVVEAGTISTTVSAGDVVHVR